MKNNLLKFLLIFFIFFQNTLYANELDISASEIKIDKKNSEIQFIGSIKAVDESNNVLMSEEAYYLKEKDFLKSKGATKIITRENYVFESENVEFDNKNNIIKSNYPSIIFDTDGNKISLEMFNYNSIENVLFSKGKIKMQDKNNNIFNFTEIYIDEKKKENNRFRRKIIFK